MKRKNSVFGVCALALLLSSCSCQSDKKPVQMKGTTTVMEKTQSGLRYEILKPAADDAKKAQAGQTVVVDYTGWLDDGEGKLGQKFDSSVDRGERFSFNVGIGQVIRGWDETLLDMKVGEKRRVYIPSELGYGARGAGGAIPPNADLIFDVELYEIK
ncbi:FKBP-type peptidyl-prolyl cis-trans isomerase [bacterium]|jgi:FKBP-type peptidyl-prolyl cis-trans isomerase|nr:FKBP-type peptidyl-prolyl cis-trans isomerase [bacterium]MBT5015025.1 FKBP-type peptidyl-prolyl cis-trans isomerase [bacterium]